MQAALFGLVFSSNEHLMVAHLGRPFLSWRRLGSCFGKFGNYREQADEFARETLSRFSYFPSSPCQRSVKFGYRRGRDSVNYLEDIVISKNAVRRYSSSTMFDDSSDYSPQRQVQKRLEELGNLGIHNSSLADRRCPEQVHPPRQGLDLTPALTRCT